MAIIVALNSYFTVDAGEKGVFAVLANHSGSWRRFGFKIPVVDSLIDNFYPRPIIVIGTRRKDGEVGHGLNAYTRDQQSVNAAFNHNL